MAILQNHDTKDAIHMLYRFSFMVNGHDIIHRCQWEPSLDVQTILIGEWIGMLLEYRSGAIYLDNQSRSSEYPFYLTPNGNGTYKDVSHSELDRPDQQYVYVDFPNRKIVVNASWYGEYPLFYFVRPGYCAISDRFDRLHECISASIGNMQLISLSASTWL